MVICEKCGKIKRVLDMVYHNNVCFLIMQCPSCCEEIHEVQRPESWSKTIGEWVNDVRATLKPGKSNIYGKYEIFATEDGTVFFHRYGENDRPYPMLDNADLSIVRVK